jgi:hypothetical protein
MKIESGNVKSSGDLIPMSSLLNPAGPVPSRAGSFSRRPKQALVVWLKSAIGRVNWSRGQRAAGFCSNPVTLGGVRGIGVNP